MSHTYHFIRTLHSKYLCSTTVLIRNAVLTTVFFVALYSLVPLTSLAQESEDSNATTSDQAEAVVPAAVEKWYTSDWISGELDKGDFVIGPGKVEVTVKPGETVVRYITVTNRISDNRKFKLVVEDIAGTVSGDAVALLGSTQGPYTLKDYVSFPETEITLGLGERARIPVSITIPKNVDPGGHYGSVLVTTVRDDSDEDPTEAPGARSPIVARVGVLFFVTVPGDIAKAGETKSLSLIGEPWWYEKGPIQLGIVYENTGSIHLNPYGELRIKNMFGEEVGYMEVDPWFVLPQSMRTKEITWDREFLLGRYVAEVQVNRGYDDIIDTERVVFWVLPWKIVGGTFVVIFVLLFVVRTFFRTFEFKRKKG